MKNNLITVLEITSSHLKLCQSKVKGDSRIISKLFCREIPSAALEETAKAVNELVTDSKTKSSQIILAIPRQSLTLRVVRLPSQDDKEIEKMVELQITKQIPFPVEEISSDYLLLEKESSGYSQILIAICRKEMIKRYLNILSKSTLRIERITLSSEGLCRWLRYFSAKNNISETLPVVLLDIDKENTDFCFYRNETLLFTRSVPFGITDLKSAKFATLIEELRKTISILQRDQIIAEISKILLTNTFENANLLVERLKQDLGYEVNSINPLEGIPLEKELKVPFSLTAGNCSLTAIIGFCLGRIKDEINLLPREVKREEEFKVRKKDLIFLGMLVLLLIGFSFSVMATKIYKKERYLKRLNSILTEQSPKAKKTEDSIKKLNLVKERLSPRPSSIDVIYELYNLIPEGVTLSIFSLDESQIITLQGISVNMSDVFNFQSILEKSPNFKNVEVKYASKRKLRQAEVTDFRITALVDKEKIIKP